MAAWADSIRRAQWQTFTKANTKGGLPDDWVVALAQSPDGTLWVLTQDGLGHLRYPPRSADLIVDVVSNSRELTQPEQTFVAIAVDSSYVIKGSILTKRVGPANSGCPK
jgi:hypothetical protein